MSRAMGSKYCVESSKEAEEFYGFVHDLLDSEIVNEMRNYRHHYDTSCFQHCLNVSYYNYLVCRKLGLDARKAARAGMLHDLFLYDWRERKRQHGELPHGFRHPYVALDNAKNYFELSEREEDMIVKHMWPLTLKIPKYAESYVIVMIDKYAAVLEMSVYYSNRFRAFIHGHIQHQGT